jgi:cyanophycinase
MAAIPSTARTSSSSWVSRANRPALPKATMMLIGGNIPHASVEEINTGIVDADSLDPSGIFRKLLSLSSKKPEELRVLVVTSASTSKSAENAELIQRVMGGLGISPGRCQTIDTHDRTEMKRRETARLFRNADVIFFGGGDQGKLLEIFKGTYSYRVLKDRIKHDPELVFGGTSAGAMFTASDMIGGGTPETVARHVRRGAGFIEPGILDTHADRITKEAPLGRDARTLEAKLARPGVAAISLDEATALILCEGQAETYGQGMVKIMVDKPLPGNKPYRITVDDLVGCNEIRNAEKLYIYRFPPNTFTDLSSLQQTVQNGRDL